MSQIPILYLINQQIPILYLINSAVAAFLARVVWQVRRALCLPEPCVVSQCAECIGRVQNEAGIETRTYRRLVQLRLCRIVCLPRQDGQVTLMQRTSRTTELYFMQRVGFQAALKHCGSINRLMSKLVLMLKKGFS